MTSTMVTENQALPSLRQGLCGKFILAAFFVFSVSAFAQEYEEDDEYDEEYEEEEAAPVKKTLPKPAASIAQMLGRTSLSRNCVEDFASLLETGYFDMASFAKELVPAAAKTRLKLKSPFGKPKDSEMT
ncbi:MAG: hypothetical protein LBH25_04860, partial [Fibromonadaceae bacterium]|nr:hypothetical protein [Fibromonadaceae bacterium]